MGLISQHEVGARLSSSQEEEEGREGSREQHVWPHKLLYVIPSPDQKPCTLKCHSERLTGSQQVPVNVHEGKGS